LPQHPAQRRHHDIVYPSAIVHGAALGSIWTGFPAQAVWTAVALYLVRTWAVTAAHHRHSSHHSHKTSHVEDIFRESLSLDDVGPPSPT